MKHYAAYDIDGSIRAVFWGEDKSSMSFIVKDPMTCELFGPNDMKKLKPICKNTAIKHRKLIRYYNETNN